MAACSYIYLFKLEQHYYTTDLTHSHFLLHLLTHLLVRLNVQGENAEKSAR